MAFVFWIGKQLSNSYTFDFATQIEIEGNNISQKPIEFKGSSLVTMKVKASGWQFLFAHLSLFDQKMILNFSDLKNYEELDLSTHVKKFQNQLSKNINIVSFAPNKLYFKKNKENFKRIPVKLALSLFFEDNFENFEPIKISPDSITIFGPDVVLKNISFWKNQFTILKGLTKDSIFNLPLDTLLQNKVFLSDKSIQVEIPVDHCTEYSIQLPIGIRSDRKFSDIQLIPNKCTLTCLVPLKQYHSLKGESFDVYIDLNRMEREPKLRLNSFPNFVKNIKLNPVRIHYFYFK